MSQKKDLYNLHCRIKHSTADKLKTWAEESGDSVGEMLDQVVELYEHFCNTQDEMIRDTNIYEQLSTLLEKVERIEKKVGA